MHLFFLLFGYYFVVLYVFLLLSMDEISGMYFRRLHDRTTIDRYEDYARMYAVELDDDEAYANWRANDRYIEQMNERNLTYRLGHNRFSIWPLSTPLPIVYDNNNENNNNDPPVELLLNDRDLLFYASGIYQKTKPDKARKEGQDEKEGQEDKVPCSTLRLHKAYLVEANAEYVRLDMGWGVDWGEQGTLRISGECIHHV